MRFIALLTCLLLGSAVQAEDLFRGEAPDPAMQGEIRDCLRSYSERVIQACRFHVSEGCYRKEGADTDICFLREAATWDRAMEREYGSAMKRLKDWDMAEAADALEKSHALFQQFRAQTCQAEAIPYGTGPEGSRAYVSCLITLTSNEAMRLSAWGEI